RDFDSIVGSDARRQPATGAMLAMPSPQLKPSTAALPDESTDGPSTTAVSGVPEPTLSGVPSQLKPPAEIAIAAAAISTRMKREAVRIMCATRELDSPGPRAAP